MHGSALPQGRRISNSQQFEQIGVVPGGFEAFSLDSALGRFVVHPWPSVRFDAIHPRQEPHAVVPLVGISAGGIG